MRIRRVILLVLDGLRHEVVDRFNLATLKRIRAGGSAPIRTRHPLTHRRSDLSSLPGILAAAHLPTSAFSAAVPPHLHCVATRVASELGVADFCLSGNDAPSILQSARHALSAQRRGLILMHWPDAGRVGRAHGWTSAAYEEATRRVDTTLSLLMALTEIPRDSGTLLVVASDADGADAAPRHDPASRWLDQRVMMFMGGGLRTSVMPDEMWALNIPAMVLWALGLPMPADLSGALPGGLVRHDPTPAMSMERLIESSVTASIPAVSVVM